METKDERDKLMFRVRVRIDPERLRARAGCGEKRPARRRLCAARSGGRLAAEAAGESRAVNERERLVARIEDVTSRYGAVVALDAVTLEIPAGCMVGFIGPDGVGKSSLLSLLAGARRVQYGDDLVLGGDMGRGASGRDLSAHRLYAAGIGKKISTLT